MKRLILLSFCLLFVLTALPFAHEVPKVKTSGDRRIQAPRIKALNLDCSLENLHQSATPSTTLSIKWTFGDPQNCDTEGWSSHDLTEQPGCYWHVDDFAGMAAPYGPLDGSQSLWCGARPDSSDENLCSYATLPGYGNYWEQAWVSRCFQTTPILPISLNYLVALDCEPGYDYAYVEYAEAWSCEELANYDNILTWNQIATYTGQGTKISVLDTIPVLHNHAIRIRFRFVSDGAWSDEDGIYNSDGAILIDSLMITDGTNTYDFEDFEGESPGDITTTDGDWSCCVSSGFGDFASLYPGNTVLQEDPCQSNSSWLWAFINGSTYYYWWRGYSDQAVVPCGNVRGQFIDNEIWSPIINWQTSTGTRVYLQFDIYGDLDPLNCVFYTWAVRYWELGDPCPSGWLDRNVAYFDSTRTWSTETHQIGDLIPPSADSIQVALGVADFRDSWGPPNTLCIGGDPLHTHSPLFDNIELYRTSMQGPFWSVHDYDLFQDTFPDDSTSTGTGSADAAIDIGGALPAPIVPQDEAIVICSDPFAGIGTDSTFGGPAVYCWVTVWPSQPGKIGPALSDNLTRWPYVSSMVIPTDLWGTKPIMNLTWYRLRMDITGSPNQYCIGLNDNLFTPGDMILFFFNAWNNAGFGTYWSEFTGTTSNISEAANNPMEFQILPGPGVLEHGGDILYIDDCDNKGAQPYFDTAFRLMGIYDQVDRYDVRASSSCVSNSPGGSGVKSVINQLIPYYRKIIWNSGDLRFGTIGDGTTNEKADDWRVLHDFLAFHTSPDGAGIYISGDNIAEEWATPLVGWAITFKNTFIPHGPVTGDHTSIHGICPYGIGMPATGVIPFYHPAPDTLVCYGGCPVINDFDIIQPMPPSVLEMAYDGQPNSPAVISCDTISGEFGNPVKVVLSGFSFHYIRDDRPQGIPDRVHHLRDIIQWIGNIMDDPTPLEATPRFTNYLAQNYPNPFNPLTTINYSIKERAQVTLKIYNVAGQLVKTLVNEDQRPRSDGYTVHWDGRNDAGQPISSGVYFYKLVAKNFTQTKKMVLLK